AHGLGPGDNACIVVPTGHHCIAAIYGAWLCGATITLIAPPTFGEDVAYVDTIGFILRSAGPRLVVTSPELLTTVGNAAGVAGLARQPLSLTAVLADAAETIPRPDRLAECALLQFTSGSSGTPRGVKVGWANLADNLVSITRKIGRRPGDA